MARTGQTVSALLAAARLSEIDLADDKCRVATATATVYLCAQYYGRARAAVAVGDSGLRPGEVFGCRDPKTIFRTRGVEHIILRI